MDTLKKLQLLNEFYAEDLITDQKREDNSQKWKDYWKNRHEKLANKSVHKKTLKDLLGKYKQDTLDKSDRIIQKAISYAKQDLPGNIYNEILSKNTSDEITDWNAVLNDLNTERKNRKLPIADAAELRNFAKSQIDYIEPIVAPKEKAEKIKDAEGKIIPKQFLHTDDEIHQMEFLSNKILGKQQELAKENIEDISSKGRTILSSIIQTARNNIDSLSEKLNNIDSLSDEEIQKQYKETGIESKKLKNTISEKETELKSIENKISSEEIKIFEFKAAIDKYRKMAAKPADKIDEIEKQNLKLIPSWIERVQLKTEAVENLKSSKTKLEKEIESLKNQAETLSGSKEQLRNSIEKQIEENEKQLFSAEKSLEIVDIKDELSALKNLPVQRRDSNNASRETIDPAETELRSEIKRLSAKPIEEQLGNYVKKVVPTTESDERAKRINDPVTGESRFVKEAPDSVISNMAQLLGRYIDKTFVKIKNPLLPVKWRSMDESIKAKVKAGLEAKFNDEAKANQIMWRIEQYNTAMELADEYDDLFPVYRKIALSKANSNLLKAGEVETDEDTSGLVSIDVSNRGDLRGRNKFDNIHRFDVPTGEEAEEIEKEIKNLTNTFKSEISKNTPNDRLANNDIFYQLLEYLGAKKELQKTAATGKLKSRTKSYLDSLRDKTDTSTIFKQRNRAQAAANLADSYISDMNLWSEPVYMQRYLELQQNLNKVKLQADKQAMRKLGLNTNIAQRFNR